MTPFWLALAGAALGVPLAWMALKGLKILHLYFDEDKCIVAILVIMLISIGACIGCEAMRWRMKKNSEQEKPPVMIFFLEE